MLVIGGVAVTAGLWLVDVAGWITGTRWRMLMFGAAFGGLGYFFFHAWGELPAAMAWVFMAGFLIFAVIKPKGIDR